MSETKLVRLAVMVDVNIRALAKQKAALRLQTVPEFVADAVKSAPYKIVNIPRSEVLAALAEVDKQSTKPKRKGEKK